ncbi:MAG: hypothetical protein LQ346_003112 [Caloplaca aetnensis]|nr:MAG: hypothetical protein LQ346_003112 [Caloplaca aetnensis]
MQQRLDEHLVGRFGLELKIQVFNKARVSGITINEKLLSPLTHIRGYDNANVKICNSEIIKDFALHPPPCKSFSIVRYIVAQFSLARVLERTEMWQGTSVAIKIALGLSDKMIERLSTHGALDSTTLVTLLKLRVEASVYDVSRIIRTGSTDTTLDLFLGYCQALHAAQPTTRLLPLCQAIEQYLRLLQGDLSRVCALQNIVKLDPRNDLKLDAHALLQMFSNPEPFKCVEQMNRLLRFSELSATISRLYRVAGIE